MLALVKIKHREVEHLCPVGFVGTVANPERRDEEFSPEPFQSETLCISLCKGIKNPMISLAAIHFLAFI